MSTSQQIPPPPPPVVPPNVVPLKAGGALNQDVVLMKRGGLGTKGATIHLLSNHFGARLSTFDLQFYRYSVRLISEDGQEVSNKRLGRTIVDQVQQTYGAMLGERYFAYDGKSTFFTEGLLLKKNYDLTVILENRAKTSSGDDQNTTGADGDKNRMKRQLGSKTFRVDISYAGTVSMQAIAKTLDGQESKQIQEALQILDIILRQISAKKGCLLVRQSFFNDEPGNLADLGGGISQCRGFYASFKPTQSGLTLNFDTSTTIIIKPGPVLKFLKEYLNIRDPHKIDWVKAKKVLKNLRIRTLHTKREFKITGLSEKPCNKQMFSMKQKDGTMEELSVKKYFIERANIVLKESAGLPCINVGKPKYAIYLPLELCELVSLQRYTNALSSRQRASLCDISRQKPEERRRLLQDALRTIDYNADPMLQSSRISISPQLCKVEGRVLQAPQLVAGNLTIFPTNGRWNFNGKQFVKPVQVKKWAVVNFSANCDIKCLSRLCKGLISCGEKKGVLMNSEMTIVKESDQHTTLPPATRVDRMFQALKESDQLTFLLCILPEKKNSDLYGPWKRKCLSADSDAPGKKGIVTQCLAASSIKFTEQYLTNLLLKINAKLGGLNFDLNVKHFPRIPLVSGSPTLILGMDVSHGPPGRDEMPSIAAVVSSREWPLVSKYRATVHAQSSRLEMIQNLYNPTLEGNDNGIFRDILCDFCESSSNNMPEHIIIFRDGVSEGQFKEVLNTELDDMIKACEQMKKNYRPKFTFVIAQKNHHTRFFRTFPSQAAHNVPPGTVVDSKVCHPKNNDFYMCAHAGTIGTTRPTHYHVLIDEVGFTTDELQELIHSLCYVYQRSTTAVSQVAPVCYAHHAAAQLSQFIKSDKASVQSRVASSCQDEVPALPKLCENVRNSMFFC